jgi:hypothetical protein
MRSIPQELIARARRSLPDELEAPSFEADDAPPADPRATIPLLLAVPKIKAMGQQAVAAPEGSDGSPADTPIPLQRPRGPAPKLADASAARTPRHDGAGRGVEPPSPWGLRAPPAKLAKRGIGALNKLLILVVLGLGVVIAARTWGLRPEAAWRWLARAFPFVSAAPPAGSTP